MPPLGGLGFRLFRPRLSDLAAVGLDSGVTYDQWIDSSTVPAAVHSPFIGLGGVLQTLTTNAMGAVDGTAYMVLQGVQGAGNAQGRLVEAKHGG